MPNEERPNFKRRATSPKVVIDNSRRDVHAETVVDYPRSREKTWRHALPRTPEAEALSHLKDAWESEAHEPLQYEGYKSKKEFLRVDLDDFEIYTAPHEKYYSSELTSLEHLDVRGRQLWFDGVLSVGNTRRYVQGARIKVYSIEGYGEQDEPNAIVHVLSHEASGDTKYDIWYRLRNPSRCYRRFHRIFHWVATLGKHTIDFLETRPEGILVGLDAFRHEFYDWLTSRFPNDERLQSWIEAYGRTDFRKPIHAHIDYLGQEAYNLANARILLTHRLWADCMRDDHQSIQTQPIVSEKTVTTPHVFLCFRNRYFGGQLMETQPCPAILKAQERRKQLLGFPSGLPSKPNPNVKARVPSQHELASFKIGDVVAIIPDETEERLWRKQTKEAGAPREWFAYVQNIEFAGDGNQRLFVIWIYRPEDTTISTTDYPVSKELFLSDHCNCAEPELLTTDVIRKCTVDWFSNAFNTREDFFIRQKYLTEDNSFISLSKGDFNCDCKAHKRPTIESCTQGDTVYIIKTHAGKEILEPVVIHHIDIAQKVAVVFLLLRLKRDCSNISGYADQANIPDNELAWTHEQLTVSFERIVRKCHVRHFSKQDIACNNVDFPYDRGGAGDYWILSSQLAMSENGARIESLFVPPDLLNQGPDFSTSLVPEKLAGLSLFSGLGNLDKGLEAAGAVTFNTSVDMCPEAIHTLRANSQNPDKLNLWLGSVDDYIQALLDGKDTRLIARIGEVAVIAAGSPCPGFSTLQRDWQSERSLRNASHVTTFCSFVDIYRPKWAILENVVNMACLRRGYEEELVLSQLIACLVSLGYQVRQFIMSSWNYAGPQRRSRLILSIAAPGLVPLSPPAHTHSHPNEIKSRSIGELLNGQKFGAQEEYLTPFQFVTAEQAVGHLPDIGNGNMHNCLQSPDHRLYRPMNSAYREIMKCVPIDPPGQGITEAIKLGLVRPSLYSSRAELGKAYKRMNKDGLIPTITTQPSPHDSRTGAVVHWAQNRPITIEEARLAQGIPTDEVIIGSAAEQIKMVGNAVDRRVAEALGLAQRRAVEESSQGILHADEGMAKHCNKSSRPKKPRQLVCVRIPRTVPFTSGKPSLSTGAPVTSSTAVPDSDNSEYDTISRSTGLGSVIHVNVPRASPSIYILAKQDLQDHSSSDTEIDEQRSELSSSFETLEMNSSADGSDLPHSIATHDSFFRRLSRSLVGGISLLRPPLPRFANIPVREKRPREDEGDEKGRTRGSSEESTSSKRARHAKGLSTSNGSLSKAFEVETSEPGAADSVTTLEASSSSPHRGAPRRTRHSGLQVEYAPKAWSKIPELEIRKEKGRDKRISRSYA